MTIACRVVPLFLVVAALQADPLFCCTLSGPDRTARFTAPVMDCCAEEESRGCAQKLGAAPSLLLGPVVSAVMVLADSTTSAVSPQASPAESTVSPASASVERPQRLPLLHSQFRI